MVVLDVIFFQNDVDMKLYRYEAQESISFGGFDSRFDGKSTRVFLGLCLPGSQKLEIFKFQRHPEDHKWKMSHLQSRTGDKDLHVSTERCRILENLHQ